MTNKLPSQVARLLNQAMRSTPASAVPPDSCLLTPDSCLLTPDSCIPPPASSLLTPNSCFRSLLFTSALQSALAALESAGIPAIAFKGPALAVAAYGNVAAREYRDLDIYVPPAQVQAACATLATLGYTYQRPSGAAVLPSDYELTLENPAGIQIDLHWRFSPPYLWDFDDTGALSRSILISLAPGQPPIRTLSPEYNLLYLAIHAAKDCFSNPHQILDIASLIARSQRAAHAVSGSKSESSSSKSLPALDSPTPPSCPAGSKSQSPPSKSLLPPTSYLLPPAVYWPFLLAQALRTGTRRPLAITLSLAQSLFDAAIPPGALECLAKDDPGLPALVKAAEANLRREHPFTMDTFRGALFHIRLARGARAKLLTFKRRLLDPNQADTDWLRLPRPLAFLYPLLRPIRLILHYGPFHRLDSRVE